MHSTQKLNLDLASNFGTSVCGIHSIESEQKKHWTLEWSQVEWLRSIRFFVHFFSVSAETHIFVSDSTSEWDFIEFKICIWSVCCRHHHQMRSFIEMNWILLFCFDYESNGRRRKSSQEIGLRISLTHFSIRNEWKCVEIVSLSSRTDEKSNRFHSKIHFQPHSVCEWITPLSTPMATVIISHVHFHLALRTSPVSNVHFHWKLCHKDAIRRHGIARCMIGWGIQRHKVVKPFEQINTLLAPCNAQASQFLRVNSCAHTREAHRSLSMKNQ